MAGTSGGTGGLPFDGLGRNTSGIQGPGPFNPTDNNRQTGASRQIGEFGDYPVGQVDVRTDMMRQLEQAALPLLTSLLDNPQGMAQMFGSIAGPVPGAPQTGLSNFLFNDAGAFTGQPQGPQGPGMPPGGGGPPAPPPPPAQPPGDPSPVQPPVPPPPGNPIQQLPTVPVPTAPVASTDEMWKGVNLTELNKLLQQGGYGTQVLNANKMKRDQLSPFYNDPLAWEGYKQSNRGMTLFSEMDGGKYNPEYGFANVRHLLDYFVDPSKMAQPHADYTKKNTTGGKISEAEWKAWVDAFNKQGGKVDKKAKGGKLNPNKVTMVGEQGPELIGPAVNGQQQVMPLQNTMQTMGAPAGPQTGNFASSPIQGQGTGSIQRLLEQNPEMEAFNASKNILFGQGGALGAGGGGQQILQALQPLFRQNLDYGLTALSNRVPSMNNSAAAVEGADLTSRAMNDFNLFAAQAMQQGQSNTLGGLGLLGQLAGQAGGGQFGRHMQAGQLATQRDLGLGNLGLQAQQQQYSQMVNPTLQLLLAAMGMATPTAYQTVVPGKK